MNPLAHGLAALPFLPDMSPLVLIAVFVLVALWTLAIKGFALWHAARNGQRYWFIALLVINTLGIFELVYILAFRKDTQSYVAPAPAVAPSSLNA